MALIRPGIILPFATPVWHIKMYSAAKSHVVSVLGPPPTRYAVHMTLELNRTASTAEQLNSLLTQIMENFSVSDHEGPLTDEVEAFLNEQEHLTVRRHGDTVVASTDFGKPSRVILAGHLDTVPVIDNFPPKWLEPGDSLIREEIAHAHPEDRVLWGRGATDMKASDAVMLYLAATLDGRTPETTPKVDLTYVFYDHEEVVAEKNGLRKVVEAHPDWITGDFAIIGEPTNSGIEGGCNGTIRFDVVTHGVAAHSARAWMGENAIHKAADILNRLNAYEPATVNVDGLDYREGLNATLISGGKGTNVIPDECRVHVNYRFAPDKSLAEAKALMMGGGLREGAGWRWGDLVRRLAGSRVWYGRESCPQCVHQSEDGGEQADDVGADHAEEAFGGEFHLSAVWNDSGRAVGCELFVV